MARVYMRFFNPGRVFIFVVVVVAVVIFSTPLDKMAPKQHTIVLVFFLKFLLTTLSVALQMNFMLLIQILHQHQALKREVSRAIEEKNRALKRYNQLRNKFLRRRARRQWKNPGRTDKWWSNAWTGVMLPEEWIANFRMSKEDFMTLEQRLRPYLHPSRNSFRRDTISSFKKLAMTLYYLKDQGSLRMTSNLFGVAPCTLSCTIRKVCDAIVTVMGADLIKFPTTKEGLGDLMSKFEEKFGFPMVVGCIDGTHIPVRQPTENAHDYFCYKMKYSINVQAVCDHEGMFLDVDCSWPGSVHDAKVFANSKLNKLFQEKRLPNVEKKLTDDGIDIPPVLIGDPAYPLLPGLLKEYSNCTCNEEVYFNIKLRSVRNQIECAFGRLKARWRILTRPIDLAIEHVPTLIYACFILHNFCESRKVYLHQEAVNMEMHGERSNQDCVHHSVQDRLYSYNSNRGSIVREGFKEYFGNFL